MTTVSELDPLELLALAEQLIARPDSPSIRTGCDRAYYAAFLFARDQLYLLRRATPFWDAQDHTYIPGRIKDLPRGAMYGNTLMLLYRYRCNYTYDTKALTSEIRSPKWMLDRAKQVIEFIQNVR